MKKTLDTRRRGRARGMIVGLLVLAWGCETDPAGPAKPGMVVAAVEIIPDFIELFVTPPGNSAVLTVTPMDEAGQPIEGLGSPTFTSGDPSIATVDPSGRVTAAAPGTTEVTASFTAGGIARTGTASIAVVAAATAVAERLAITTPLDSSLAGLYIGPSILVVARDSAGRTDSRFEGIVEMQLQTNPGRVPLLGTTLVRAVRGVAIFRDLRIREPGSGYTLVATAFGLEAATSGPFEVKPAGRIAFVSDRDGTPKIYLMNADGSDVVRLTSGPGADSRPAWSSDGRRIVFARGGDSSTCGIYVMNADGSGLSRLTTACGDMTPAWSPDGGRIAFAKWTLESLSIGIYVMNADGSGVTRLTESLRDEYPDWSPDGRRIVFTRYLDFGDGDGIAQAHVMDVDGSNIHRLTFAGRGQAQFAESGPAWSPDGSRIVFWSYGFGIAIVNGSAGDFPSTIYKGTSDLFDIGDVDYGSFPDWSPDGKKIVFARAGFGAHKLAIVNATGGGSLQPLSTDASSWEDYEPAWTGVSP